MHAAVDKHNVGFDWMVIMLMKTMILTEVACVLTFIWDCFQLVPKYQLKVKIVSPYPLDVNVSANWIFY